MLTLVSVRSGIIYLLGRVMHTFTIIYRASGVLFIYQARWLLAAAALVRALNAKSQE